VTKAVKVVKKDSNSDKFKFEGVYATGKRKNSIVRVFMKKGKGNITVNGRDYKDYFHNRVLLLSNILRPLRIVEVDSKYDIYATASGGGVSGQAGALAQGISKTLVEINPDWKKVLKDAGLITRDSRVKEAKKYGRKKARKGFQYRKR